MATGATRPGIGDHWIMAMTTDEALALAEGLHKDEQVKETAEVQEVEHPVSGDSSTPKTDGDEPTATSPTETTSADIDKQAFAFAREKARRKELKKHYEEQIATLKQKLKDRTNAKPSNEDIPAYVDYRLELDSMDRDLHSLQDSTRNLDMEDIAAENERRIATAFPTEGDRESYKSLLASNGKMFLEALNKCDPEHTVLDYLDGQQDYPLLLKELMTNVDSLKSVFQHKDVEGKLYALETINRRLHTTRKPLPKIGRLVRNNSNSASSTRKDTAYWNNWLKNHPKGRI